MKRNFLKNSLTAFVFTLAIVASFAFSSSESDDFAINAFVIDGTDCLPIIIPTGYDNCDKDNGGDLCIINFKTLHDSKFGTVCIDPLKRPV